MEQQALQPATQRLAFRASRWVNALFPAELRLEPDGIHYRQPRLIGSIEERINYRHVASVRIKNGIFLCNVLIETSGGSDPIVVRGLWKRDGRAIQDGIRARQP